MTATDEVTQVYRRQNLALRAAMLRDLQRIWPALRWDDIEGTFPAWFAAASTLVARDSRRAAGLASAYLNAHRMAAGVGGSAAVALGEAPSPEKVATSLRVTTAVALKRSAMAGKTAELAMRDAFVQSSGAATRLALDVGRDTIRQTVARDSRSEGWRRVTSGASCEFCRMLAGRGAVYKEATAHFASHDHCGCSAEPVYR